MLRNPEQLVVWLDLISERGQQLLEGQQSIHESSALRQHLDHAQD